MELFVIICLIILLMSIQLFNTISNVYLMKFVLHLSKENNLLKNKVSLVEKRLRLSEWTQLKFLQFLRDSQSG